MPDSGGEPETVLTLDEMPDDVMHCWRPNTGASSARLCWEGVQEMMQNGMPSAPTPTGISMFPGEQVRPSRRWAERRFADLVHFNEPAHGGHRAAMEQPAAFADELRATFRALGRVGPTRLPGADGTPGPGRDVRAWPRSR